jgi:predicted RNA-binding Zn ribbon-like protein
VLTGDNYLVPELAFEWIGGDPALDFHNTVSWRRDGLAEERLRTFSHLVAWGQAAHFVPRPRTVLARTRERPAEAARALSRALGLRATLHAIFTAIADGRAPGAGDLRSLNRSLSGSLVRLAVARQPRGFGWTWTDTSALVGLLGPIAWSAARLLTSDDVARVGRCANEDCGWLFVDRSRRHNRRWCEMRECGSRAKARRYYARKRAGRRKPEPL